MPSVQHDLELPVSLQQATSSTLFLNNKVHTMYLPSGMNVKLAPSPLDGLNLKRYGRPSAYLRSHDDVHFALWLSRRLEYDSVFLSGVVVEALKVLPALYSEYGYSSLQDTVVIPINACGQDLYFVLRLMYPGMRGVPGGPPPCDDDEDDEYMDSDAKINRGADAGMWKRAFDLLHKFQVVPEILSQASYIYTTWAKENPIAYVDYALKNLDATFARAAALTAVEYSTTTLLGRLRGSEYQFTQGALAHRAVFSLKRDVAQLGISLLSSSAESGVIKEIELSWCSAALLRSFPGFVCPHPVYQASIKVSGGQYVDVSSCVVSFIEDIAAILTHPDKSLYDYDPEEELLSTHADNVCPICRDDIWDGLSRFITEFSLELRRKSRELTVHLSAQ